ncbi:hypothetical protein [Dyella sedimenti]|uniref:hypothetical protein n=1 Tax=Dyella sedimenti TaxID=2919947 RepID=UPI001FAB185E|nr:hypothetical protein [Dyella sedimenti]
MNVRALLIAPWRCSHTPIRWITLVVLLLCTAGGIAIAIFSAKTGWMWPPIVLYSGGLAYVWAFYLCSLILLAIDARQLRLPGMQRAVIGALLFYALLSVVPATLLCGLFDGDMLAVALLLSLVVLGALSFALLPRYYAILCGLLPALYNALKLHIPGPGDAAFLSWAPAAVLVLAILCVWRWHRLVRDDASGTNSFRDAMVLQYRRSNQWGAINMDSTQQVRQRPDWLQPQVDLRLAGPQRPDTALRVALGGWYLPKTPMGHLRSAAPVLLIALVPVCAVALGISGSSKRFDELAWLLAASVVGWVCLFGGMGAMISTVMLFTQRWRKPNAELSLLALLPGLGDNARLKRELLWTGLRRPLLAQAVLAIVLLAMAIHTHASAASLLLVAVTLLGGTLCLVACLLCTIGGRPLPGWALTGLGTALGLLIGAISFLPSSMVGHKPLVLPTAYVVTMLVLWVAMDVLLLWLARRGWRAWRQRPHPFLSNA